MFFFRLRNRLSLSKKNDNSCVPSIVKPVLAQKVPDPIDSNCRGKTNSTHKCSRSPFHSAIKKLYTDTKQELAKCIQELSRIKQSVKYARVTEIQELNQYLIDENRRLTAELAECKQRLIEPTFNKSVSPLTMASTQASFGSTLPLQAPQRLRIQSKTKKFRLADSRESDESNQLKLRLNSYQRRLMMLELKPAQKDTKFTDVTLKPQQPPSETENQIKELGNITVNVEEPSCLQSQSAISTNKLPQFCIRSHRIFTRLENSAPTQLMHPKKTIAPIDVINPIQPINPIETSAPVRTLTPIEATIASDKNITPVAASSVVSSCPQKLPASFVSGISIKPEIASKDTLNNNMRDHESDQFVSSSLNQIRAQLDNLVEVLQYRLQAYKFSQSDFLRELQSGEIASLSSELLKQMIQNAPFCVQQGQMDIFLSYLLEGADSITSQELILKINPIFAPQVKEDDNAHKVEGIFDEWFKTHKEALLTDCSLISKSNECHTVTKGELIVLGQRQGLQQQCVSFLLRQASVCSYDLRHINFQGLFSTVSIDGSFQ